MMLISLHIENIAVIKNVDIDFHRGFTALTGETGAGKSIIIDSINLLSGARISKDLIRTGETSAMVSAMFSDISDENLDVLNDFGVKPDEDGMLMIQRNISADGKSSTRLNGRIISSALQKDIGRHLINIHGQHDNQELLQPSSHVHFLDSYADLSELLSEYGVIFSRMNDIKNKIADLSKNEQEKERLIELLKYQINDIESAKLKSNEEETLLLERTKIQNYEKILKQVKLVYRALYRNDKGLSAFDMLTRASDALDQINDVLPDAKNYIEKLESYKYELEDIAESVRDIMSDDYDNPTDELNRIESRLEIISKLKRKYGSTTDEIITFRDKAVKELEDIELSDIKIVELNEELAKTEAEAYEFAKRISAIRKEFAVKLENNIMNELQYLEMGKVIFKVRISNLPNDTEHKSFTRHGIDNVEFLISTNPGEPLKPLNKIASGGELSRIMLALKCVFANHENISTIIFDEIDTGISGKTSQKIGVKLKQLSEDCQVICVTHSAQIASTAHNHLYINKIEHGGRVETTVAALSSEERINEIARIMGGLEITDNLLETAKELIENNKGV